MLYSPALAVVSDISLAFCMVNCCWIPQGVFQHIRCWLFSCFTLFCWLLSIWWALPMVLARLIPHRVTGNVQLVTWWLPANKELLFSNLLLLPNERVALIFNSLCKLLGFVLFGNDYLDFPVPVLSCHFHSRYGAKDIAKEFQKYCLWSLN